jgi:hypothetical protein
MTIAVLGESLAIWIATTKTVMTAHSGERPGTEFPKGLSYQFEDLTLPWAAPYGVEFFTAGH